MTKRVAVPAIAAGALVLLLIILWLVNRDSTTVPAATGSPAPATSATSKNPATTPAAPALYRVPGDLCPAVDYAVVAPVAGQPAGEAFGDHEDKAEFTAFTCDRKLAAGTVTVTALIFQSGPLAAAHFAQLPSPAATAAQLWFQDGNLVLGVRLKTTGGAPPAAWRAAAGDLAKATMPKLKA